MATASTLVALAANNRNAGSRARLVFTPGEFLRLRPVGLHDRQPDRREEQQRAEEVPADDQRDRPVDERHQHDRHGEATQRVDDDPAQRRPRATRPNGGAWRRSARHPRPSSQHALHDRTIPVRVVSLAPQCTRDRRRCPDRTRVEPGDARRQYLLERSPVPMRDAIVHLVGLQAQIPANPYVALWSRLADFDPESLSQLLLDRQVVRIVVMRGTLHLVTADDALLLRPLVQPVLDRELERHSEHAPKLRGVDLEPVLTFARTLLAEHPRSGSQLRRELAAAFPDLDAAALAYACRNHLALVQVPPRGLWRKSAQVTTTTAEAWLGRPLVGGAVDRRSGAPILRRVRAGNGRGRIGMVAVDRAARSRRAGRGRDSGRFATSTGATSSTGPMRRGPTLTHRRRSDSSPSTTTSCSRTRIAPASASTPDAATSARHGRCTAPCSRTDGSAATWHYRARRAVRAPATLFVAPLPHVTARVLEVRRGRSRAVHGDSLRRRRDRARPSRSGSAPPSHLIAVSGGGGSRPASSGTSR